ncbi:hypothetical protein B7463_g240, partial [Scytalidium lignicola]
MKLSILAVATALAGSVVGQSISDLPTCAQSCVTQFTSGSSIGGCSGIDIACICSSPSFLSNIACCLAGACNQADQVAATNFAQSLCKTAGVTNLPDAVSCLTGTATPTTTATRASQSSSSSTSAVTTHSSTSTSTPSASATSAASAASSPPSSSTSSVSSSASSSAAAQTTSSAAAASGAAVSTSGSSSSSTSATATPNAGPQNVVGMGAGILGGFAAAVALL